MKIVLSMLFNFDMFSSAAWVHMAHSHLHGFGGFVFGILILAAIPIYIATTLIIIRTQRPLFTIPIPQFITRAFTPPAPITTPAPPPPTTDTLVQPDPIVTDFPADMPSELRGAFIRARRGGGHQITSAFNNAPAHSPVPQPATTQNTITMADDFPLPTDFDTPSSTPSFTESGIPNFTSINFNDPISTPPTNTPASPTPDPTPAPQNNDQFTISGDYIIITHDDPDFWIADDTDWFASGKQRPSPITAVKARAAELNLKPVLYLAQTNILDLDARIAAWESDGVRVITNLDDLK